MPIKLIQVQRKLNVGINTVVEFLRKKGFEVEDNNPNTRIGDEQYALLVKEFGKDLPNGGRERERVVPERSHREASSVKEEIFLKSILKLSSERNINLKTLSLTSTVIKPSALKPLIRMFLYGVENLWITTLFKVL